MDYDQHCDALQEEIDRMARLATGADPATPVPTCPEWRLADLISHTGQVHRWVDAIVRRRAASYVDRATLEMHLPPDEAEYPAWLAAGAGDLLAGLRATPPDTPMWSWGPDHRARFWARRMVHETVVHRADAELALGQDPVVDPTVAVDGIDEFLENLPAAAKFAPAVKNLKGAGESLHWHAVDADGEWMIELNEAGFVWDHGHGKATVAVRGPSAELLLLAYGRRPASSPRLEVFGERAVLDRWVAGSAI